MSETGIDSTDLYVETDHDRGSAFSRVVVNRQLDICPMQFVSGVDSFRAEKNKWRVNVIPT